MWKLAVCILVCAYLLLGAVTHSLHWYHAFLLLAIPGAIKADERGRRFFIDWSPMFGFWLAYDRLRLVQPFLLGRVAVEWPYRLEQYLFGWTAGGGVPPHAARAWLAPHLSGFWGSTLSWILQLVYFSQICVVPGLLLWWWWRGRSRTDDRRRFVRHIYAFTVLNIIGIGCYLAVPVAPPWWVSLYGMAQPTPELVRHADIAAAMDGAFVQRMISTAPHWFAAVPSLHGAYPLLLLLLAVREHRPWWMLAAMFLYCAAMWTATVVLNQHYVIDLLIGAAVAGIACWVGQWLLKRTGLS